MEARGVRIVTIFCWFMAAACAGELPATSSENDPGCTYWMGLKEEDRFYTVASSIQEAAGPPESSAMAACLWTKTDLVQEKTTEICTAEQTTSLDALGRGFESAVETCTARSRR